MDINNHESGDILPDSQPPHEKEFPNSINNIKITLQASISRGIEQSQKNQTQPHEDVMAEIRKKYKIV